MITGGLRGCARASVGGTSVTLWQHWALHSPSLAPHPRFSTRLRLNPGFIAPFLTQQRSAVSLHTLSARNRTAELQKRHYIGTKPPQISTEPLGRGPARRSPSALRSPSRPPPFSSAATHQPSRRAPGSVSPSSGLLRFPPRPEEPGSPSGVPFEARGRPRAQPRRPPPPRGALTKWRRARGGGKRARKALGALAQ